MTPAPVLPRQTWLARLLGRLGFRWIFPFGTFPVPYHPLLVRLMPIALVGLMVAQAISLLTGAGLGIIWWYPLIPAALLGIFLSIPVIGWAGMVLMLPLLQAILIASAVILASIEVATGRGPPWLWLVPASYFGLFAVQWAGGRLSLWALQRRNAAFRPLSPGTRLVRFDDLPIAYGASPVLEAAPAIGALTRVTPKAQGYKSGTLLRLPPDAEGIAEAVASLGKSRWTLRKDGLLSLQGEAANYPGPPIALRMTGHRSPLWLVSGHRQVLHVYDGNDHYRLIGGAAAVIGHLPLMTLFHVTALSNHGGHWVAGFARQKPVNLGPTRPSELAALAFAPDAQGFADMVWLTATLAADGAAKDVKTAADRANATTMLDMLLAGKQPLYAQLGGWGLLTGYYPDLAHGRGAELCAALSELRDYIGSEGAEIIARLLSQLPRAEYQALAPQLLTLLNSKKMAYRVMEAQPASATPPANRVAKPVGLSLVKKVPLLYARLGELGEQARPLITGLGELNNWPEPLALARETLDTGQMIDLDSAK